MSSADPVAAALGRLVAAIPDGERREPQEQMATAVADAIDRDRHLLAQAGTGTGKSWAYLVPAIISGRSVLVATATKALQDQLAGKDLPFLREHLGHPFDFAVLKGRSNYVCRQRIAEMTDRSQPELDGLGGRAASGEISALTVWAETSDSGDRAELPTEPSPAAWAAVSVSSQECPGAARCPEGESCFAELARRRAAAADVTVVNLHLLGLDIATDGAVLPERDLIVVDEAHQLEDIVSDTAGFVIGVGRFQNLARAVRAVLDDPPLIAEIEESGALLTGGLVDRIGRRLRSTLDAGIVDLLVRLGDRLTRVDAELRKLPEDGPANTVARIRRARQLLTGLRDDVSIAAGLPDTSVTWVEGPDSDPRLRVAPIEIADLLETGLWSNRTTILTSATLPDGYGPRLGLAASDHETIDVGSPFDYEANTLLYCATHLPAPGDPTFDERVHDELEALIGAAGGRTLGLFTSYRAMDAAVEELRQRLPFPILSQRDLPKPALIEAFSADPETCLFATMGFWQGIDVPGPGLGLVTIDRLPFPRPDDPLLQARRDAARGAGFRTIDLPRAATMLAQGAGRLIRTGSDRGVIAVLDPRLSSARSYRWDLLNALPPFPRTRDRSRAESLLREIGAEHMAAVDQ